MKKLSQLNAKYLLPMLRLEYCLTQLQVAEGAGISNQTISDIENGKIKTQNFTILKLNMFFKNLGKKNG